MPASDNSRGSILIAALVMTLLTGTLVGLYLKTVVSELTHTHRYTLSLAAVNLAEAGLEYALEASLWSGWDGWTTTATGLQTRREKDDFTDITTTTASQTRALRVYLQSQAGQPDIIISEGTISLANGLSVTRQVGIEVETTSQRFWVNAILGRDELEFAGNQSYLDSFSSANFDPVANPGLSVEDYYNDLRLAAPDTILGHDFVNGNAAVASLAVTIGAIEIGNADIYGSLATGAPQGTNINSMVGPNGSLYNEESEYGVNLGGKDSVDESYISYEFYAELPLPDAPVVNNPIQTDPGSVIGSPNTSSAYQFTDLSVPNNTTRTVEGNVKILVDDDLDVDGTLIINGDVTLVIADQVQLSGEISIANTGSLEVFVGGDVDIGGNGVVNLNKPESFLIYSTSNELEDTIVRIRGNSVFSGAVYAPNSEIEVRGGAEVFGALVGNSIEFTGNVAFHYDEVLSSKSSSWTEQSAQIIGWREILPTVNMDQLMANGYSW
jgi:hypothetical protein